MKHLALGCFILVYASFATLCFASGHVSDLGQLTDNVEATISHHQHQVHSGISSVSCGLGQDNCATNNVTTVLGHAAMYDSLTSFEVVSLSVALLLMMVLFLYCRRLFREIVKYGTLTWFRYKVKEPSLFLRLNFLAWTAFHTRSPNLLFIQN